MCFLFLPWVEIRKLGFFFFFFKEVTAPPPSPLQEGLSAAWVPRDPLPECGESSGRAPSSDMNHTKGGLVIFTANSHPSGRELSKRIAEWVAAGEGIADVLKKHCKRGNFPIRVTGEQLPPPPSSLMRRLLLNIETLHASWETRLGCAAFCIRISGFAFASTCAVFTDRCVVRGATSQKATMMQQNVISVQTHFQRLNITCSSFFFFYSSPASHSAEKVQDKCPAAPVNIQYLCHCHISCICFKLKESFLFLSCYNNAPFCHWYKFVRAVTNSQDSVSGLSFSSGFVKHFQILPEQRQARWVSKKTPWSSVKVCLMEIWPGRIHDFICLSAFSTMRLAHLLYHRLNSRSDDSLPS